MVSRQASAENPTGAPGGGCQRDPDPTDPDLPFSGPAMDLGRGWKVRPYVPLAAGDTLVLADVDGPGVIRQLFLTTNAPALRPLVLRCTWDHEDEPSIESPMGDFFGIGQDPGDHTLDSAVVTVAPARGCSAHWPMPFRRHARITLTNEGAVDAPIVAYRVAWEEAAIPEDAAYLHARWRRTRTGPDRPEHVILDDVRGRGAYVGTTMTWTTDQPGWWGEGEVKFHLDGDGEHPSIVDNGTEDYFGGAWGFGRDLWPPGPEGPPPEQAWSGTWAGCPLVSAPDLPVRRFGMYRWHVPDPIGFRESIRVAVQSLGWGPDGRYAIRSDEIASTAFWYQVHPNPG
ncbi:MAG: DUF2961 domain-containing protein [Chloroflexi bacterium]|nr:DUF2961 domain-containing protein [Chloroflexota bacterium]